MVKGCERSLGSTMKSVSKDNLQRFNLTEPETIFDLRFFQREPGEVTLTKIMEPTPEDEGVLLTHHQPSPSISVCNITTEILATWTVPKPCSGASFQVTKQTMFSLLHQARSMNFAENCGLAPINRPSLITLFACTSAVFMGPEALGHVKWCSRKLQWSSRKLQMFRMNHTRSRKRTYTSLGLLYYPCFFYVGICWPCHWYAQVGKEGRRFGSGRGNCRKGRAGDFGVYV